MNRFSLLLFSIFFIFNLKAQDKIISTSNETILCRIVSMDDERILYEVVGKNGYVTGKFIKLSQVASYMRSSPTIKNPYQQPQRRIRPIIAPEHVWNFRLNVGKSTMPWYWDIAQDVNSMQDYYKRLKTGYHINTSAIYMISNNSGFGVDYTFMNSSFNGNIQTPYETSSFVTTSEIFNQYLHFLGPSFLFQQHIDVKRKFTVSESVSVGAHFLRIEDQNSYPIINQTSFTEYKVNSLLTSLSMAAKVGITTGYRITPNVSFGLGGGFTVGSFTKANLEIREPSNSTSIKNQKLSNALNMSRFDYSFALSYQF